MTRLEQLRKLAALEPHDPFTHYSVGLECLELERWDEALAAFDAALARDPQYFAAQPQRARVLLKLGRRADAADALRAGVAAAQLAGDRHAADHMTGLLEAL